MPAKVKKGARDVLVAARALVAQGWCQGHLAVDKRGKLADLFGVVNPPVAFCALGALHRAAESSMAQPSTRIAALAAVAVVTARDIAGWNDKPGRTQKQVLRAYDKAIGLSSAPSSKSKKGK